MQNDHESKVASPFPCECYLDLKFGFLYIRRIYIQINIHLKVRQGLRCIIITIFFAIFLKKGIFPTFGNSNNIHRNFLVMSNKDPSESISLVRYREMIKKDWAFIELSNLRNTLLPRIQVHAFIYETTHFCKWSGGFVYKCVHQIMRV